MKKILLCLIIIGGLSSCDMPDKYHLRSFVMNYFDAEEMRLEEYHSSGTTRGINIRYSISFIGGYDSAGSEKAEYDALCEKHNDMTYNRSVKLQPWEHTDYIGVDFVTVDIVSDADFDEDHLLGESLGDIVLFRSHSIKPFIDNGYTGHQNTAIYEYLSELSSDQLVLLGEMGRIGRLEFKDLPTLSKTHTFTVTMTADDGRVFEDSIDMTFE